MGVDLFTDKEKVAVIRRPDKCQIVQRKSDGAIFEASWPGYLDLSQVFTGPVWFFRRIEPLPDKWWRGERWKRTGEVWETDSTRDWSAYFEPAAAPTPSDTIG